METKIYPAIVSEVVEVEKGWLGIYYAYCDNSLMHPKDDVLAESVHTGNPLFEQVKKLRKGDLVLADPQQHDRIVGVEPKNWCRRLYYRSCLWYKQFWNDTEVLFDEL